MKLSDKALRRIAQSYLDDPEPNDFLDKFEAEKLLNLASMAENAHKYFWEVYEAKLDGHTVRGEDAKLEEMLNEIIEYATKLKE